MLYGTCHTHNCRPLQQANANAQHADVEAMPNQTGTARSIMAWAQDDSLKGARLACSRLFICCQRHRQAGCNAAEPHTVVRMTCPLGRQHGLAVQQNRKTRGDFHGTMVQPELQVDATADRCSFAVTLPSVCTSRQVPKSSSQAGRMQYCMRIPRH